MAENKQAGNVTMMAHMIPYFPNEAASLEVVKALLAAGITYLEVQFPFTDPSADGPVIESACTIALKQGFTVNKGFAFVKSVSELCKAAGVRIFVMTYGSLVYARGIDKFVADAKAAGASGLIVPDLPPDTDEGLYAASRAAGLECVPVVTPNTSDARIEMVRGMKLEFIYCALRAGITGTQTKLDESNLGFLQKLNKAGFRVLGGFGISEPAQVRVLRDSVHAVIVGSAIMRTIQACQVSENPAKFEGISIKVEQFVRSLVQPGV